MYRIFVGFASPKGPGRVFLDVERPPVSDAEVSELEAIIAGNIRSQGVTVVGLTVIGEVTQPAETPAETQPPAGETVQ